MTTDDAARGFKSMADILAAHPLFEGLDRGIVDLLAGCSKNVHFPAGAFLFKMEEPADAFFLLRSGDVALELDTPGRETLVIQTLRPGEIVGASWILPPYRWRFDARATGDVRATSVDAACLREKSEADPKLGYQVMQRFLPVIARRLHATRLRLLDLYAPPSDIGRGL